MSELCNPTSSWNSKLREMQWHCLSAAIRQHFVSVVSWLNWLGLYQVHKNSTGKNGAGFESLKFSSRS